MKDNRNNEYRIIEKNFFYVTVENQPPEPRWLKKLRDNVSRFSQYALLIAFALYAFHACRQQMKSNDKQQTVVLQQKITDIDK